MKNAKTKKREMLDMIMKETILTASAETLQKHGIAGFTMDRVAADANIAKGTVYLYFKNKNELIIQLVEKIRQPMIKYVIEIKESNMPVEDKFEKIFYRLLSDVESNLLFVRILFRAVELDEQLRIFLRKDDQSTIKKFEEILLTGIKNKEISVNNPGYAAKTIFAAMIYMVRERGEGYTKFMPVEKEVESFIGLLKYGFTCRKEAKKIGK